MSKEGTNRLSTDSSTTKRPINEDDDSTSKQYSRKRRKLEPAERPSNARELAPRPLDLDVKPATPITPAPVKVAPIPTVKRSVGLNLKNYPSNHHPVAIAVWILQKIDQARRELDVQRNGTPTPTSQDPSTTVSALSDTAASYAWNSLSNSSLVNRSPAQEVEAERLQSQRNRKTKQRQENWAKNKETDVVARTKIEAKKHFDAIPNSTDADQQAWIEDKVRVDYGRLLDRLAVQVNSEIVGIPPFQIGFADFYFSRATNPQLKSFEDHTISAARLVSSIFPALTESVVSTRHQNAADALIHALEHNTPPAETFIAVVFMFARDYQILMGIDKLMGYLFLPKTGPQLARKRVNATDQLGNPSLAASAYSSTPHGAPIWHWKEPATILNPRISASSKHATATGSSGVNVLPQSYQQDPLPPPVIVQAEVFRPPVPPPLHQVYYKQTSGQSAPQNYAPASVLPPNFSPPTMINAPNNGNYCERVQMNGSTPPVSLSGGQDIPEGASPELAVTTLANNNTLTYDNRPGHDMSASNSPRLGPSVDQDVGIDILSPRRSNSPESLKNGSRDARTTILAGDTSKDDSEFSNPRRRSSRGTRLTSKAKAAGVMLGKHTDDIDNPASPKTTKTSKASKSTTSPDESSETSPGANSSQSNLANGLHVATTSPLIDDKTSPKQSGLIDSPVTDFVPRSSGRERKPTAKVIESSTISTNTKSPDHSNSVPRVRSKLNLSLSTENLVPSENPFPPDELGAETKISSPKNRDDPLPKVANVSIANQMLSVTTSPITLKRHIGSEETGDFTGIYSRPVKSGKPDARFEEYDENVYEDMPADFKLLSNAKGQSMSQALLELARIAAEWSESDDSEDGQEFVNDAKVKTRAVTKKQKSKGNSTDTNTAFHESPQALLVNKTRFNATSSGREESNLTQDRDAENISHHAQGGQLQLQADVVNSPLYLVEPPHQQKVALSNPSVSTEVLRMDRNHGDIPHYAKRLLKAKEEAIRRGLSTNESMDLEHLTNIIKAHDTGNLTTVNKPSLRPLAPSPGLSGGRAYQPAGQNGAANGHANPSYSNQSPAPQLYGMLVPVADPSQILSSLAAQGTYRKITPRLPLNGYDSGEQRLTMTSMSSHPNSTDNSEAATAYPLPGSTSWGVVAQQPAGYERNPQGLNGGPLRGGIITTEPDITGKQAMKKGAGRNVDSFAKGGHSGSRKSTPSTREATPQPPQRFKRGGTLLTFDKKVKKG